jgi:hypothetical protein
VRQFRHSEMTIDNSSGTKLRKVGVGSKKWKFGNWEDNREGYGESSEYLQQIWSKKGRTVLKGGISKARCREENRP